MSTQEECAKKGITINVEYTFPWTDQEILVKEKDVAVLKLMVLVCKLLLVVPIVEIMATPTVDVIPVGGIMRVEIQST